MRALKPPPSGVRALRGAQAAALWLVNRAPPPCKRPMKGDEGREGDEVSSSKEGRICRGRSLLASQPHAPALRKAVKETKAVKARKGAVLEEGQGCRGRGLLASQPSTKAMKAMKAVMAMK